MKSSSDSNKVQVKYLCCHDESLFITTLLCNIWQLEICKIACEVPQGSILRQLLFTIYTLNLN